MRILKAVIGLAWTAVLLGALAGCGSVPAKQPDAGVDETPDSGVGCTANAYSCGEDDALYQCDADGVALTKVQSCQYGCTVDRCNDCDANTTFCSSDDLVTCSGDGKIVNPQACEFGCQMDRCNTCEPGTKYCDNATAVTCGANGEPSAMMSCGAPGCLSGVCNTCTPNTTTCQGDTLVVCNGQGTVQSATTCALGCGATPNAHCNALVPSYSVTAPSGSLPSLTVTADATLDISNCSTLDVLLTDGSTTTAVPATQLASVSQSNGSPICVVRYNAISIAFGVTLTVKNSASTGHVLSLQATGDIDIAGTIAFVNAANGPRQGGSTVTYGLNGNNDNKAPGGGGGGGASAGGNGGACVDCSGTTDYAGGSGGAAVTTITTLLTGGSKGGSVTEGSTVRGVGGQGGGGLQLVSLTRVAVAATGKIDLNGRGGGGTRQCATLTCVNNYDNPTGGGGSGGSLVVEAPAVSISAGAIVAANGGGGGGGCNYCDSSGGFLFCGTRNGEPGQLSAMAAAGGRCGTIINPAGSGGYGSVNTSAPGIGTDSDPGAANMSGGGGGGAAGFVILRARSAAAVMVAGGAVVSPGPVLGAVTAN